MKKSDIFTTKKIDPQNMRSDDIKTFNLINRLHDLQWYLYSKRGQGMKAYKYEKAYNRVGVLIDNLYQKM